MFGFTPEEKIKKYISETIESGEIYSGGLENINPLGTGKESLKKSVLELNGTTLIFKKFIDKSGEHLLILCILPVNSEDEPSRNVGDRIMKLIDLIERCVGYIDFIKFKNDPDESSLLNKKSEENKFKNIIILKKINGENTCNTQLF